MPIHWETIIKNLRRKPLPWKICFYCNNIQKWSSASLIRVLQTDDCLKNAFMPSVFIAPETFNGKEKRIEQFRQLKDFFGIPQPVGQMPLASMHRPALQGLPEGCVLYYGFHSEASSPKKQGSVFRILQRRRFCQTEKQRTYRPFP